MVRESVTSLLRTDFHCGACVNPVSRAHIICLCTNSSKPMFDGKRLAPGTHINGVGSYRPDMQELDETTVRRSNIVLDCKGGIELPLVPCVRLIN